MISAESYQLDHFYYGQLVRDGQPEGDLRVLSASPGLKTDFAFDIAQQALIPPLADVPDGAWAIVRGKKAPFIMVQAQIGEAEQTLLHYILMPTEVLRAAGGNLDTLIQLVDSKLPVYDRLGDTLPLLLLPHVKPPETSEQIEHILQLMTYAGNRLDVIESLLAAIVQGVQLIVQNAPRDLRSRVGFIQGLLALLPPPARFGVTFTTHSVASTRVDAQIRFLADDQTPSPEALVFRWSQGQLSGKSVADDYSHFIVSLLRLDADLVIQRTQSLTAIAAWRIKRGDGLAEALGYGSYREAVDKAVLNNLPVEAADVARVLAEDPTLDDSLRLAYARHLMAFSLALNDMQMVEPIAILLRSHPDLEQMVLQQMTDALGEGRSEMVFNTLSRWLANPLGPEGASWVHLTHRAILHRMDELIRAGQLEPINIFLEEVHRAHPGLELGGVVPKLVEMALPLGLRDRGLAQTTFLLSINYLDIETIKKMLAAPRLLAQLPKPLTRLLPYIDGSDPSRAPAGLLADTATAFGDEWNLLVLTRLCEAAMIANRKDLFDTPALSGLVQVALSAWGMQYDQVLRWVVQNLSTPEFLRSLEEPGPRLLLQILLARGAYGDLANEMIHQSRVLYPGDLQAEYALMVQRLFAETPITIDETPVALSAIEKGGIKSLPLAMAYIGALEGRDWSPALDTVAAAVTTNLNENRSVLNVIHPSAMLSLLKFHARRHDVPGAVRLAGLFPQVAANHSTMGLKLMIRMYRMMDWEPKARIAALELLRRYVRQADNTLARQAVVQAGRELGEIVRNALEATYAFKRLMGGVDLLDYAGFLHTTAEFLEDTAQAYTDKASVPSLGALMNAMQSLTGGVSNAERDQIARAVISLGRAILILGEQHRSRLPRETDKHYEGLIAGRSDPNSGLDVMRIAGGYFAKGKRYTVRNTRTTQHPLAERSAPMLRDEAEVVNHLLRGIIQAFPADHEITLSAATIRGELESLWGGIALHDQRQIVRGLAIDFQRVAEWAAHIADQADDKALTDTTLGRRLDSGKQAPRTTIEFYRYVHGYFRS